MYNKLPSLGGTGWHNGTLAGWIGCVWLIKERLVRRRILAQSDAFWQDRDWTVTRQVKMVNGTEGRGPLQPDICPSPAGFPVIR